MGSDSDILSFLLVLVVMFTIALPSHADIPISFINKKEFVNAYTELNDPFIQLETFKEQVKARAAMMTAMRQNELTTTSIAKLFGSDHSTVCHHTRKHEANLATWPGYEKNYITAVRLCGETLRYKAWQSKLHSVKASIARLKSVQRKLEETIKNV